MSPSALGALVELFAGLSVPSGTAFVVVVHGRPGDEVAEGEIEVELRARLELPVARFRASAELARDHVYVFAAGSSAGQGRPDNPDALIDDTFELLAGRYGNATIGVLLSGTSPDGERGMRRVRAAGGLTIAQDPGEAGADEGGARRDAASTASLDRVLPLSAIAEAILRYAGTRPRVAVTRGDEDTHVDTRRLLEDITAIVAARTGRDVSGYKCSTLLRAITRRMRIAGLKAPSLYVEQLYAQPGEAGALADDVLDRVTSFFRDPRVFEALERTVIPAIFDAARGRDTGIRVWSAGCATGEEAYSLAMLLLEEAARRGADTPIQVFASELHGASLGRAREGIYATSIEADVSPQRLARWFERTPDGYRVCKAVRDQVVFVSHDVLADRAFEQIDLIACRYLLTSLQRALRRGAAARFLDALRPDGVLVLGQAELIDAGEGFRCDDEALCIYRKRRASGATSQPSVWAGLHQRMLERTVPPSVLVDDDDRVVHLSPGSGRFLVHPGGAPTADVVELVREELRVALRAVLPVAREQARAMRSAPVALCIEGHQVQVVLEARPAQETDEARVALVLFDEQPARPPDDPVEHTAHSTPASLQARVRQLETERTMAEQRLAAVVEAYDKSRASLIASNREQGARLEQMRATVDAVETRSADLQARNERLVEVATDLEHLVAAAGIATVFLDRELRIVRFTPSAADLFHVRAADRGRLLSDFSHRLDYGALHDDAREALQRAVLVEREVRDDSGLWYLARLQPHCDDHERVAGVALSFVEITRLKTVQIALQHAKDYAEQIVEALPEPLLVISAEGVVVAANAAFCAQFELADDQTTGCALSVFDEGQWNIAPIQALVDEVLGDDAGRAYCQIDTVFERLGRRVLMVNARRLDDMRVVMLGIHDITKRFVAEQALRASETRYRTLAELCPEAIFVVSAGGRYVFANAAAARLVSARTPDELVGREPTELVDPKLHVLVHDQVRQVLAFGRITPRVVYPWRRLDGRQVEVELMAGPIEWQHESAVLIVAHDVTERQAVQRRLREANRDKDEYLAMLGHELRNPLAAICSAIELVADELPDDAATVRAMGVLERQATHMSRIIDRLLEVSRLARGKVRIERQGLDLRELVACVVHDNVAALNGRGLELVTDLELDPLWVEGDRVRLVQIFDNLLGNAIKFTDPPGQVRVEVVCEGDWAVTRVRDTGQGIEPDSLSRIFESFHQGPQRDAARSGGGLGLGLALARTLVELHHGTITAHSDGLGHGACFVVRLPLASAPEVAPHSEAQREVSSRRVLVVEDNPDAANMMRFLLERVGHEVTIAGDGRQALERLDERDVDVVLSDLGLPGMSGLELASAIRSRPALAALPLVALTGYGQPEDRQRCLEAGFVEHVVKPVDLATLRQVIERVCDGGG